MKRSDPDHRHQSPQPSRSWLKGGFTQVPHQLEEALAQATDLWKSEYRLMMVVQRFTLGFHRLEARLSSEWIAKQLSIDRRNVQRTLRSLENRGILARLDPGGGRSRVARYRLQLDVTQWQVTWAKGKPPENSVASDAVSPGDDEQEGRQVVRGFSTKQRPRGSITASKQHRIGVSRDAQEIQRTKKNEERESHSAALARGDFRKSPARSAACSPREDWLRGAQEAGASDLDLDTIVPDAFPLAQCRFVDLSPPQWRELGGQFAAIIRSQRGLLDDLVETLTLHGRET